MLKIYYWILEKNVIESVGKEKCIKELSFKNAVTGLLLEAKNLLTKMFNLYKVSSEL